MYAKARKSNLSYFTDSTKHASASNLSIHRQQTIHWIFTQTKLSSNYRHCHLLGLEKTLSVAYNLAETPTSNNNYFFTFWSRGLCRNSRKRVARREKL